jgi:hypothetical protein
MKTSLPPHSSIFRPSFPLTSFLLLFSLLKTSFHLTSFTVKDLLFSYSFHCKELPLLWIPFSVKALLFSIETSTFKDFLCFRGLFCPSVLEYSISCHIAIFFCTACFLYPLSRVKGWSSLLPSPYHLSVNFLHADMLYFWMLYVFY